MSWCLLVEESPCEYSIDIEYNVLEHEPQGEGRCWTRWGGGYWLRKNALLMKKIFLDHDLTHQQNVNVRVLSVQNLCTFALNM